MVAYFKSTEDYIRRTYRNEQKMREIEEKRAKRREKRSSRQVKYKIYYNAIFLESYHSEYRHWYLNMLYVQIIP